jgi:hypothetical protein
MKMASKWEKNVLRQPYILKIYHLESIVCSQSRDTISLKTETWKEMLVNLSRKFGNCWNRRKFGPRIIQSYVISLWPNKFFWQTTFNIVFSFSMKSRETTFCLEQKRQQPDTFQATSGRHKEDRLFQSLPDNDWPTAMLAVGVDWLRTALRLASNLSMKRSMKTSHSAPPSCGRPGFATACTTLTLYCCLPAVAVDMPHSRSRVVHGPLFVIEMCSRPAKSLWCQARQQGAWVPQEPKADGRGHSVICGWVPPPLLPGRRRGPTRWLAHLSLLSAGE